MKITNILITCIFIITIYSCGTFYSKPAGFKYKYDGAYTGLDTIINTNGYYMSRESSPSVNNSRKYNNYIFYTDGLVCYLNDNNPHKSFKERSVIPGSWGRYIISKDTIKCQFIINHGVMGGIALGKVDFLIINNSLIKEMDDSNPEYVFNRLDTKIDSTNWLLKKKWFYKKDK